MPAGDCPTEEMSDLPMRLIDWFHVLKTNEIEKEFKDQGIEREPALKGMKFMDSKMKSMCKSAQFLVVNQFVVIL